MRTRLKAWVALVSAVLLAPAAGAAGIDLHWLWHDRCYECHGHAGDFARKFLSVSNGELQGRHHIHDLQQFLHHHYLIQSEAAAVYNMLLAQADIPARFKAECSRCHDTAAEFVRNSLQLRDGVLYGRKSGTATRQFLENHRKLNTDDIEFFMEQLTRVAHEVYRP